MSKKDLPEFKGYVITNQKGDEVSVIEADSVKEALQIYFITISTYGLQNGFSIVPVAFMRVKS